MESEKRIFYRKLWGLVFPIAIQNLMTALVSASDAFMLGFVSQTSLSAVSLATQIQFVHNLFMLALTIGATTLAAQYWGKGELERAREYGDRLFKLAVFTGAVSGLILLAVSPVLRIFTGSLSAQAHSYLKNMMYICTYYMIGKSVNATVIAGVFCAGGDTKFGLKCDAVTMWVILIPIGMIAAFVLKLPVMVVYFIISMDEIIKLPAVYRYYKKYNWVRNLTELN